MSVKNNIMPVCAVRVDTRKSQVYGISGGSAFRAVAGFGRHGKLHEETFFELPVNSQ